MIRKLIPALVALVALLGVGVPATAGAAAPREILTKCANVGFGSSLVCIDVNRGAWVTVWYDKRSSGRQTCRLRYSGPDGGHEDEGEFVIDGGQLKGYRWYPPVHTGNGSYNGSVTCHGTTANTGTLVVR
ncbi:hypothetical protein SAMN05216188_102845 [Lentzea xinjiangensis]|uniref:Secreted protein n=1 Tax=Lentzea xinjiangensis TaxID=402600 RepID=A0A1H9F9Z4_9PSEU|nr:hypothetical protein [Lentzea xinjiangensis]SEQ34752.1 hypothetical protein SAMN05216188_102845 [Lentzea xinjiangensis]